jgi:ABC-type multidrug transport system fused ATPase/permease subunit
VTVTVAASESIGVIGPSRAGKSMLVQLMLRLRAPTSGAFLVNGEPAGSYAIEDWSRLVPYVPQQPRLIHASVADNVRFYRELGDEEVERACRLARIHDDIVDWPQSLTARRDDMTLFVVAHLMSTLAICDRVMVVLDGEIDAFDGLEALGEANAHYREAAPAAGARSDARR